MATSEVSICNMALFRIGHTQRIDALTEASVPAELCKELYPICRDRLLECFPWTFAKKRVVLASVGDEPTNWLFQYQYPSDCLKVRGIVIAGERMPTPSEKVPFEVMQNTVNEGLSICTDCELAEIVYTAQTTNTRLFTPGFVDALAWCLASELVSPLARDTKFITLASNMYPLALAKAQALDMSENQEDYPTSEFINVRD
jgi:hypothetical protein